MGTGGEKEEKFAGTKFGTGEVSWWSSMEELRKLIKTPQAKETSRVAGFLP